MVDIDGDNWDLIFHDRFVFACAWFISKSTLLRDISTHELYETLIDAGYSCVCKPDCFHTYICVKYPKNKRKHIYFFTEERRYSNIESEICVAFVKQRRTYPYLRYKSLTNPPLDIVKEIEDIICSGF